MFGKILGKDKKSLSSGTTSHSEIVNKIAKMNLPEMRSYVNNKTFNFEVCEDGLVEVLKKLTILNEDTQHRYIQIDDMDSKIKKGFELIITIASSKKISVEAVELIQEFITVYEELIKKFDTENKQIYASKLNDALSTAINGVNRLSEAQRKMSILGE
jgi:hypothetical protein